METSWLQTLITTLRGQSTWSSSKKGPATQVFFVSKFPVCKDCVLCTNMYLFGASSGPGKGMDDRENRRRMKSTPKRAVPAGRDSSEIDFELPLCSKYLLLAAYIASRNAATLDASLFDTGDGARASSRKKRKWASYLCLNFHLKRIEWVAMCPLLVWSDEMLLYSGMVRNQSIHRDFISPYPSSGVFRIVCSWSL